MARAPKSAPPAAFYDGEHYVVADSVGYLMHLVFGSMRRQVAARMAEHGLSAAQWYPRGKLKRDGPGTAQDMARDMDIDAGALTRLIDRLAAKGLVQRQRSISDRRVVMLSLSAAGEAVVGHVPGVLASVNNDYLRGFSERDWRSLKRLLRLMLDNGQALAPAADERHAR
jgi:DNA-binding MarR family transcriptional regulator